MYKEKNWDTEEERFSIIVPSLWKQEKTICLLTFGGELEFSF